MRLNVLYQFNDRYAPFAGVSITSLCENNKNIEDIRIYILGENLNQDSVCKLETCVQHFGREIIYVNTDNIIEKMKNWGMPQYRGSYAANIRLFLTELLPEEQGKILYLDADTIISGDLTPLLKMDLDNNPIAMSRDALGTKHKHLIGLGTEDDYFNSGVILFDMKTWKEMDYSNKIIQHIKNVRTSYPSPDQDLLNVVCKDHISILGPEYNFQPIHKAFSFEEYKNVYGLEKYYSQEEVDAALDNIQIHHMFRFIGGFPWNCNNVHPDNDLFDSYLECSEWKDYQKQPVEAGLAIKIEKVLYQTLPKSWFLRIFKIAHERFIRQANEESLQNKIDKRM